MSDMDEDVYDEEEDYDLVSEQPFLAVQLADNCVEKLCKVKKGHKVMP